MRKKATMVIDREFGVIMLRQARATAKLLKIKIPKLSIYHARSLGNNPWREVYANGDIIWSGTSHTANEAKAEAINKMIDKEESCRQYKTS